MEVYWTGISQPPNSINFPPARWCAANNGVRFKSMRNLTLHSVRGQGEFRLLALQFFDDGVVGGLGLAFAVEEERVVDAVPGKIIEPALAVVEVPEADADDGVAVFVEDGEEFCVLVGLTLEDFGRAAAGVGILFGEFGAFGAVVGPPAGARDDVDVEFGDNDFDVEAFHLGEGFFDGLEGNGIEFVMALEADGVNGNALGAERFDEANGLLEFGAGFVVVIVVDEEGVWIGGVGELESFDDEIFAAEFAPGGGSEIVCAVVEGFVDDVPHGDFAFVTADDCVDVDFHGAEEFFAGGDFVDPRGGGGAVVLGPNEGVADDFDVVGEGEVYEGVGGFEFPGAGFGLDGDEFHAVLGGDDGELRFEQGPILGAPGDLIADADADWERGNVFQGLGGGGGDHEQE